MHTDKEGGTKLATGLQVAVAAAKLKRKLVGPLLNAQPLLKFEEDGTPYLAPEGMEVIRKLKGKICPIVFIGDGRAGKSYLASRLIGTHTAFVSSNSSESVTEGIDIVATPVPGTAGEHLLVLDCEGGNNALAEINTLVNVFAVVACTQVVFVANSMMSEASLENLASAMAARSLVQFGEDSGIKPPGRLTFVVNKTTLAYEGDALEKTLNKEFKSQGNANRDETRQAIQDTFIERTFSCVTLSALPGFEENVNAYRDIVIEGRRPLTVGGSAVNGTQLCQMLEVIRMEVQRQSKVSGPSIMRGVVYEGFLMPIVTEIIASARSGLPNELDDYDPKLSRRDPRPSARSSFDDRTSHLPQKDMVDEARAALLKELDAVWNLLERQNELLGDKITEVTTESMEVVETTRQIPFGGESMLKDILVTEETYHSESRGVVHRKRGGTPECGDWKAASGSHVRLAQQELRDSLPKLPSLQGQMFRQTETFVGRIFGTVRYEPCYVVVQDLHVMWWDAPTSIGNEKPTQCHCLFEQPVDAFAPGSPGVKTKLIIMVAEEKFTFEMDSTKAGMLGLGSACVCLRIKNSKKVEVGNPTEWVECISAQGDLAKHVHHMFEEPPQIPAPYLRDIQEMPDMREPPKE